MKAARLHAFHQDLVVEDVPDPQISDPFDVIVRIGAAGLCRTDLHIHEGQFDAAQREAGLSLPYIPGHENAGWVESVGSAVTNVAVGDTVIVHPLITCGLCPACRAGADMHCETGVFPGLFADGGFAQYMKTGARAVIKIDPKLHPTEVAALADAGLTAYHAVKKAQPMLPPRSRTVVLGAGGLGHIGIQCLKVLTPTEIIVVDKNPDALALTGSWGADHTVVADGTQVDRVLELTDGHGAEVVIDFIGEQGAELDATKMLRRAGSHFVVGYGGAVNIPTMQIILTEVNVIGNLVGTYNELAELMNLAARGLVRLRTATYPLTAINDAMRDLIEGRLLGRGILVP